MGATVDYYDPHIPVITPTREHAAWTGTRSVVWSEEVVSGYDLVLIATNHKTYRLDELAAWAPVIVDTRNAMSVVKTAPGQVFKA